MRRDKNPFSHTESRCRSDLRQAKRFISDSAKQDKPVRPRTWLSGAFRRAVELEDPKHLASFYRIPTTYNRLIDELIFLMTIALLRSTGFEDFFDKNPDAVFLLDPETQVILAANNAAYRLLDYPAETLTGRSFLDLFPASEQTKALAGWEMLSKSKSGSLPKEIQLSRSNTTTYPNEWYGWEVNTEMQTLYIACFRSLLAVKRIHEDIRLKTAALESVHCGITIADARLPGMPLIYVNKGFELITGYKAEESLGKSCRFLQGSKRDQPEVSIIREALKKGEACDIYLQNFRKNGEPFWNELLLSPVLDEEEILTHYIGIQIDATEKVFSRQSLEESEERYRALAESFEDIIIMTTMHGDIQFCSPSIEDVFGGKPQHWLGRSFSELLSGYDLFDYESILSQIRTKGVKRCRQEFLMTNRHGDEIWMDTNVSVVTAPKKEQYIVSVLRDITLSRKAKEEIDSALTREKELNELKSNFIRIVSHEFRTPMTGISASSAFLHKYGKSLSSSKADQHHENIERSLMRMSRLLDDVLFVSRDESAHLTVQPETVSPSAYTLNLIEELRFNYPKRKISLEDTLNSDLTCESDPSLLRHILHNLVGNALKYSKSETEVKIKLEYSAKPETIQWAIYDQGIGISAECQAQIFEAFQRGDNVSSIQGTGLGLFIAKRSADLLGGRITFTSKEDRGTHFYFELPLQTYNRPKIHR